MWSMLRRCRSIVGRGLVPSVTSRSITFQGTEVIRPGVLLLPKQQQRPLTSSHQGTFDSASEETLESLGERFERLLESDSRMSDADVSLANGVLTIVIPDVGTYVINKQTPNRQIWLSSPLSGPARFDLLEEKWVYKRSGESLHLLLDKEVGKILNIDDTGFSECYLGGGAKK